MKGGNIINIIQVGAGGTGGHVVHFLSKYVQQHRNNISYVLIDGDVIEDRNISRQNFLTSEIGINKAEALGLRYGVDYIPNFLDVSLLQSCMQKDKTNIILGCIDKVAVRLEIDNWLTEHKKLYPAIYIDGGNTAKNAQVLIYDYIREVGVNITDYFKDIVDEDSYVASCSELGDQTIQANLMSATYIVNSVIMYYENVLNNKRKLFDCYKYIITSQTTSMLEV